MKLSVLIRSYKKSLLGRPDYWHPNLKANDDLDRMLPGKYYLDMSSKADYPGRIDDEGVPLLILNKKEFHFPVTIAQYGLGNYDRYHTAKEKTYLTKFFDVANWLVENRTAVDSSYVWYSYFDKLLYSVKAPWSSALSQAQAISVLIRAYTLSKQKRYLETALRAAAFFQVPVSEGGIRTLVDGRHVFYEEFPSQKPSLVLNGFVFSLWGLYDLYLVTKDRLISRLYQKGLETLVTILPRYDLCGWSRYDLYRFTVPNITSIFYHKLHVEQLKVMHRLTGSLVFRKYASIWNRSAVSISSMLWSQTLKSLHKLSIRDLCPSVDDGI